MIETSVLVVGAGAIGGVASAKLTGEERKGGCEPEGLLAIDGSGAIPPTGGMGRRNLQLWQEKTSTLWLSRCLNPSA
jgi:hypothetical protein